MNEREQAALTALLGSRKYAGLCEDTVRRAFERALERYGTLKQADKAARALLHQVAGAFMGADTRAARACLTEYLAGDESAMDRALRLHASTRERAGWRALYEAVFRHTGKPSHILDLACGLNPLALGAMGLTVTGYDIHLGAVQLINEWAAACGWQVRAEPRDLLGPFEIKRAGLALFMKLLPTLEAQKPGGAMALLARVPARFKLVTFPTRTLGGRRVGMAENYEDWFTRRLPEGLRVAARFVEGDELCFLTEDAHG
ncbi:16S rRNA (guanine(1405)-N(7))-methyltransferase RmtF [Bacillota bacterium Meth-B3]